MRTMSLGLLSLGLSFYPIGLFAQDADVSQKIVNDMSMTSGLPQSTVYSDLVTKMSSNAISSGLASPPSAGSKNSDTSREPVLTGLRSAAAAKGFILRDVELDPRFQKNLKRVTNEVNLDALKPASPNSGLQLPPQNQDTQISGGLIASFDQPALERDATIGGASSRSLPTATTEDENNNGRIWGGTPVPNDQDYFPDAVAIVGNGKICSGVLVSKDTVITAGHCYCDGVTQSVKIGTNILTPLQDIGIDQAKSSSYMKCEDLKHNLGGGDIAVLHLKTDVSISPHRVSPPNEIDDAASIRAVGFGRTPNSIGFKYQVNVIIASPHCSGTSFGSIPDGQIYQCSKPFELVAAGLNRDTCGGDSGGPIYVFGSDTQVYVVGITSRAVSPESGCGGGGVYVLLTEPPIQTWLVSQGVTFN
ncbi:S1 family peptidase (plasmid) [Rhizobium leguminosarum]